MTRIEATKSRSNLQNYKIVLIVRQDEAEYITQIAAYEGICIFSI